MSGARSDHTRSGVRWGGLLGAVAWAMLAAGCSEDPARNIESADQAARLKGLQDLAAANTEQSFAAAAKAIAHDDVMTARAAVRAVARMPQRGAVEVLARVVAEDRRPEVREEAALALSYCPEEKSAPVLRQVVKKDAAPQVRAAAAVGLGRVGRLSDVELLLSVSDSDADPLVQYQAVGSLEKILGIGFTFEPNLPEDRRRVTLERIRIAATIRANVLRSRTVAQATGDAP
ncbi:MAG: HEAT repeat domain-containing protein [Planctomycetota bacterium]|nr:HEAT repeat domain-containing protein [Planctomycetota bacterium]